MASSLMFDVKGIALSKISPAFLRANATSHTWVFSAFAELIDNAYDPDVSASELLIDKVDIRDVACLIFLDNGAGMKKDELHKMLSFGYCDKDRYLTNDCHQPIGHYGNGFKSGSMRIGMDALVFTRCDSSASIGFLSQTYLDSTKAESVVVPILEYRLPEPMERYKSQVSRNNLNAILAYSVFKYEKELKEELRALEGSRTGTKIIISNLRRLQDGNLELDFSSDPTDIRCPEAHEADMTSLYNRPIEQSTSEYKLSLREYCSILYLKPRMKITIRGHKVKSKLVSKSLSQSEQDWYKPSWLNAPVKLTIGFTCEENSEDYGLMLYHRNRLIKAYERVGYQKQPNDRGVGVVGVAKVDFLQPIHNKQDFNKDEKFNSVMKSFASKLNDYWNEKTNSNNPTTSQQERKLPDWTWAQCDQCLKWRRLPDSVDPKSLPGKWFCRNNPDGTHNRCDIPEEPEDDDEALKSKFQKTFKKKEEERKRQQRQQKLEAERKQKEAFEESLRKKEKELKAVEQMRKEAIAVAQRLLEEKDSEIRRITRSCFFPTSSVPHAQPSCVGVNDSAGSSLLSDQRKRRATVKSLPTKDDKKLCIQTETGEVLAITRNYDGDEDSAEQGPCDTASPNEPAGSKQFTKVTPLKAVLPFHPSKATHSSGKSGDSEGAKSKSHSSSLTKPSTTSSTECSISKKDSKSTDGNDKVKYIEADPDVCQDMVDIKPDPDVCQDMVDIKPDQKSLDAQMANGVTGSSACSSHAGGKSSQSHPSAAADKISQILVSNLETALAAIKTRADREKLGSNAEVRGEDQASGAGASSSVADLLRPAAKIFSRSDSLETVDPITLSGDSIDLPTDTMASESDKSLGLLPSTYPKATAQSPNTCKPSGALEKSFEQSTGERGNMFNLGTAVHSQIENAGMSCNSTPLFEDSTALFNDSSAMSTDDTGNAGMPPDTSTSNMQVDSSETSEEEHPVHAEINDHGDAMTAVKEDMVITRSENSNLSEGGDVSNINAGYSVDEESMSAARKTSNHLSKNMTGSVDLESTITNCREKACVEARDENYEKDRGASDSDNKKHAPVKVTETETQRGVVDGKQAFLSSRGKSGSEKMTCSTSEQTEPDLNQTSFEVESLEKVTCSTSVQTEPDLNQTSFEVESLEKMTCSTSVQTEPDLNQTLLAEREASLNSLQRNVYRFLQLQAPEADLGDVDNIEKVLEDMIEQEAEADSGDADNIEKVLEDLIKIQD